MMISTRGRYALRVMLDMAEHGGGEWHRLSEAAQRLQLSKKYLESIMAALSRANLVESAVGKSGGYRLTRPPEDYPVGEILRAAEGSLAPIACQSEDGAGCGCGCDCDARPFWKDRKMPFFARSFTGSSVMSSPSNTMEPAVTLYAGLPVTA